MIGITGDDPPGSAKQFKVPAAVGGLNKRDGLADMPASDANILTNMFPRPSYVELRRGYQSHAVITIDVDFGLVTDPATTTEDLGSLTTPTTATYDLGPIA